jgi:hypothetical protein
MSPEERAEFAAEVAAAIKESDTCLSGDEQQWVRLAIVKQQQSIKLRQAIIEKSLSSLIWSALAGMGYLLLDFPRNGFK